jgi:hypothetical protein
MTRETATESTRLNFKRYARLRIFAVKTLALWISARYDCATTERWKMKIEELLDKWPGDIPFKGSLISDDGSCMCAQGQVLHLVGGLSKDSLRSTSQSKADAEVARLMGISRAHSVLLRIINDEGDGAPACVIREPEKVLGDQAKTVLAFWRHLDAMTPAQSDAAWEAAWDAAREAAWDAARDAAWDAARDAAWDAARKAARKAAWEAAWDAARDAAWEADAALVSAWEAALAAAGATNEIQGAAIMRAKGQPFYFLPLFGFADPAVLAAESAP